MAGGALENSFGSNVCSESRGDLFINCIGDSLSMCVFKLRAYWVLVLPTLLKVLGRRGCNQPYGLQEVFNHTHSSLWNVIERIVGVWKNKWHILCDMKPFSLIKKEKIIIATIALHNFIRKCVVDDKEFDKCDLNPDYILESQEECNIDEEVNIHSHRRIVDNGYMDRVQNQIASTFMENRNR
ncbi:hypothetical protein K1719_042610 [Acacia pycnantha]|nr:hypothetical protein K1719_042610 [Acacia pycnantha]